MSPKGLIAQVARLEVVELFMVRAGGRHLGHHDCALQGEQDPPPTLAVFCFLATW